MNSVLLSPEVARTACDLTKERAEQFIDMGLTDGRSVYYGAIYEPCLVYAGGIEMSQHVLASFQIGDDLTKDDTSFDKIAHGKAKVCLRTGMSSRLAGILAPWQFAEGDVRWPGAVTEYGLVCSGSGFQDEIDEVLSWDLLNNAQMLTRLMFNRGPTNTPGNHYVIATSPDPDPRG